MRAEFESKIISIVIQETENKLHPVFSHSKKCPRFTIWSHQPHVHIVKSLEKIIGKGRSEIASNAFYNVCINYTIKNSKSKFS